MPLRKEATVLLTENIDSRVSPESAQVHQDAPVTFPPRSGQPHRGLYIGLGALIVLLVLVAAGISAPHWLRTRAKEGTSAVPSKDSSPKPTDGGAAGLEPVGPGPVSTPPWPQVQKFQVRHSTRRQQNYLHQHRLLGQPVELTRKASPGP